MAHVKSKAERIAEQNRRHSAIQIKIKELLFKANRDSKFASRTNSCYWLFSMLSMWVKIPKKKSNMVAVESYVLRSLNEEEEKIRQRHFGTYP